jgi:hypothetical protein
MSRTPIFIEPVCPKTSDSAIRSPPRLSSLKELAVALTQVLAAWDTYLGDHPDIGAWLRPGVADAEIDHLERDLLPLRLPEDVRELYRWHDGTARDQGLLLHASFLPLEQAIATRRRDLEAEVGLAFFLPCFVSQTGAAIELDETTRAGRPLWELDYWSADLSTGYDSVEALFATSLEAWHLGLLTLSGDGDFAEQRALRARMNPDALDADARPRRTLSRFLADAWPDAWLKAAGLTRPSPGPDGRVVTAAELIASGGPGVIRAEHDAGSGIYDQGACVLTDGTAYVQVIMERGVTMGFPEFNVDRLEAELVPLDETATLGRSTPGSVCYLARRIAPLPIEPATGSDRRA